MNLNNWKILFVMYVLIKEKQLMVKINKFEEINIKS